MDLRSFPDGFVWGVATSAQQIEGAYDEAGRGESVWDRFAAVPGNIADGSNARVACDHYHRWREDLDLLKWLGVGAYRMSISWSRVLPEGDGLVNTPGLDFYDGLVDQLLSAGIQPFVTLNHWDLPQALQERGGWASRATVTAFTDYVDVVSRRLGDRVRHWVTHNEPWCIAHLGYEQGAHAPGIRDPLASLRVAHHLLLSHGHSVEILRRHSPHSEVGIVHILTSVHPATDAEKDRDAARRFDGAFNRWYLDPLYRGGYPEDVIADRLARGHLERAELPFVEIGDLQVIATPTDFLGVNYYSRSVVEAGPSGTPVAVQVASGDALTAMGWEVYPQGLQEVLERVKRDYSPPAIYITENGAAFADETGPAGPFADPLRVEFLRSHLASAQRAIAAGVPLRGYFAWSLMDNFEWGQGFEKRFGLFHVDYSTQRRTPRESAYWYRDLVSAGAAGSAVRQRHTRREG